jgi:hypothetical protein
MGTDGEDGALGWPRQSALWQREENGGHVSEAEFARFLTPYVPSVAQRKQLLRA